MRIHLGFVGVALILSLNLGAATEEIPTPENFFGRQLGEDPPPRRRESEKAG